MANSTAGANLSIQHGGAGTRDADGNLTWTSPQSVRAVQMAGFSQFDQDNAISATITGQDLTALNLDGSGAKSLSGLYGWIIFEYVSGGGSFVISPNVTTGYPLGVATVGGAEGAVRSVAYPLSTGNLVTASLKLIDITLTGTCTIRQTVYAGAASTVR